MTSSDLVKSSSSSAALVKALDPYQANLLHNHINRLNLFQTIDQSLVTSPPQSKLVAAESSSSLDQYDDDSDSEEDDQEADDYVDAEMRRSHARHHHHQGADESDSSCDQEIVNIFNIGDDGSCVVSCHYFAPAAKSSRQQQQMTPSKRPVPSQHRNATGGYLARPSLDFEKMIKVIIKDLSSI